MITNFRRAYRVPLAIIDQRGVRDLCSALPEVKHEVEVAPMQLKCGIIHLVLMSHVVNQAAGGECSDT